MRETVEGIYHQGVVRLLQTPAAIPEGPVRVTLEPDNSSAATARPLQCGKYAHGRLSTEADFRIAEWRGDEWAGDE